MSVQDLGHFVSTFAGNEEISLIPRVISSSLKNLIMYKNGNARFLYFQYEWKRYFFLL